YDSFLPCRDLLSFPTRRSSDLGIGRVVGRVVDRIGVQAEQLIRLSEQDIDGAAAVELDGVRNSRIRSPAAFDNVLFGQSYQLFGDRKSTRLNSSHSQISYAVFC